MIYENSLIVLKMLIKKNIAMKYFSEHFFKTNFILLQTSKPSKRRQAELPGSIIADRQVDDVIRR